MTSGCNDKKIRNIEHEKFRLKFYNKKHPVFVYTPCGFVQTVFMQHPLVFNNHVY